MIWMPPLKTGIRSEKPANEEIGAPTGAPIQGQFEALCGNSTDGEEISEMGFDQGKTREKPGKRHSWQLLAILGKMGIIGEEGLEPPTSTV